MSDQTIGPPQLTSAELKRARHVVKRLHSNSPAATFEELCEDLCLLFPKLVAELDREREIAAGLHEAIRTAGARIRELESEKRND